MVDDDDEVLGFCCGMLDWSTFTDDSEAQVFPMVMIE